MFPFNDNGKMLFPKPWDSREGQWDDNINAWNVYPSVEVALEALDYRYIGQEIPLINEGKQTSFWFVGGTEDGNFKEKIPDTPPPTLQDVINEGNTFSTAIVGSSSSSRIFFAVDNPSSNFSTHASIKRDNGDISISSVSSTYYAGLRTTNLTEERYYNFPDVSGTIALVSDLTSGYIPLSQKDSPDGVATLDSGGTIPIDQLPDSVFGQMKFGGTYDGVTITASSDFPELNGQPLPAASDYEGVYFISTDNYTEGGVNYVTGDWIVSTGIEWTRVANSDAVTSVFGRTGNILAIESDYQSFYARLSQSYDNPSWINTLSYSKITGTPDFILSGDVKPSDLVGFSGAARVPISNGSGQDFFASIAASQTAISNALARYKSDSSLSVGNATLNDEAVNLGQMNSLMGSYLPLAGNAGNPMTGNIDMGNRDITGVSQISFGDYTNTSDNSLRLSAAGQGSALNFRSIGSGNFSDASLQNDIGLFRLTTSIELNSTSKTSKLDIFPSDNRVEGGNPNANVAAFHGSVTGRMPSSAGNGSGYEGSFVTQPYLTGQMGAYLPKAGGTMDASAYINMNGGQIDRAANIYSGVPTSGYYAGSSSNSTSSSLVIRTDATGLYNYQVRASIPGYAEFNSPISAGNPTGTPKLRILASDNRTVSGNPNVNVAEFDGSVLGRMDGTSGPNGYESQFTTQNYVQNNYIAGVYDSESNIYVVSDNVRFNTVSATGTASFGIPTTSNVPTLGEHITNKSYVDNNFVDKSTNQTGIGGTKEWTGVHTFATTSQNVKVILKGNTAGGTNNTLIFNDNTDTQVGYLGFASSSAANGFYINTNNDVPVRIRSNSVDVMRLGSGGVEVDNSLSVATTVPSSATPVGGVKIGYSNSLGTYIRGNQNGSSTRAFILQGYAVSGNQLLLDMGGVSANGAYTNTSDSTIKNIVTDFDYSAVDSLKATSFTYKDNRDSGRVHVGYIAQEVREVLPDAVYESEETGLLSVDHVQVLIAKIALIEDRIKQLESLNIN